MESAKFCGKDCWSQTYSLLWGGIFIPRALPGAGLLQASGLSDKAEYLESANYTAQTAGMN